MQVDLWHGTNQDFDVFDREMLGLNNANTASRAAFFMAANPETARDYAHQAARNLVPDHLGHEARVDALLARAEDARTLGQLNLYEDLLMKAEELEFGAIQAEPAGAKILQCRVTFLNPLVIDDWQYSIINDLGGVLEDARRNGHDVVILRGIDDTPSGAVGPDDHYAIFNADQIEIIEVISIDVTLEVSREKPEEELLDMAM